MKTTTESREWAEQICQKIEKQYQRVEVYEKAMSIGVSYPKWACLLRFGKTKKGLALQHFKAIRDFLEERIH